MTRFPAGREGGTQYQRGPRPQVSEGSEGKVLKMDGPSAQGFLSLTRLRREGCGGGFAAIFKVSVTGLAVCVICDTISSATYFLVSP